ncbi:Wzz/FepE/Etk N-terminal domain-containing protein [Peribacillus sp. FSL H8-0477]|uniref:YveK family protein n=1 Tax=Peribacillus sp. FSL H8-0477 TaxID=2921388 RepID=UPI0030FC5B9F
MKGSYEFNKGVPSNPKEINLAELLIIIKKRLWIIILIGVIFASAGYYRTLDATPLYSTTARIIMEAKEAEMKTLQVIIKDVTVLQKVVDELNLPLSPEALAGSITVESVESSQVVSISVVYPEPILAAEIANTTARIFKEEAPTIIGFEKVRILSPAKVNENPINTQNGTPIKFAVVGIAVGIGVAFLLNVFDYTIRNEQEIEEELGFVVIGQISKMNKKNSRDKKYSPEEKNNQTYSAGEKLRGEPGGVKAFNK